LHPKYKIDLSDFQNLGIIRIISPPHPKHLSTASDFIKLCNFYTVENGANWNTKLIIIKIKLFLPCKITSVSPCPMKLPSIKPRAYTRIEWIANVWKSWLSIFNFFAGSSWNPRKSDVVETIGLLVFCSRLPVCPFQCIKTIAQSCSAF
jgi:hypothetical protein